MHRTRILVGALLVFALASGFGTPLALSDVERVPVEFSVLQGKTARPFIGFKTLEDSRYTADEGGWQLYDVRWYSSYNTSAPFGINDGGLWQGKGLNTSLSTGVRYASRHVSFSFKPQLSFSQNLPFPYTKPDSGLTGPGAVYGYYSTSGVDAPQRFGDDPFFFWDWGDSEIRFSYGPLTVGFGSEYIWLGPAVVSPLIHSDNAPGYPHLDIGLTKTTLRLPWNGWYAGDFEMRAWWGYLTESKYFNDDDSDNHNLFSGLSVSWAWHDFSITFNRIMLSKWDDKTAYTLFHVATPPFVDILFSGIGSSGGKDNSDSRASLCFDYLLPKAGLELYLELGRNDYSPSWRYYMRYPFHTLAYTVGLRKSCAFSERYQGEVLLEVTNLEGSDDYLIITNGTGWTSFYEHHRIRQGHTNGGQWLGAGIGTGGNSQLLAFRLYNPSGYSTFYVWRQNPDLGYSFHPSRWGEEDAETHIRANLHFGAETYQHLDEHVALGLGAVYTYEWNPTNGQTNASFWRCCNLTGQMLLSYTW